MDIKKMLWKIYESSDVTEGVRWVKSLLFLKD